MITEADPFYIGRFNVVFYPTDYWIGSFDDIRIYCEALSAA